MEERPLTLRGPDIAVHRSGLKPAAPALAAQFGEDWRNPAAFSLYAVPRPSLTLKEALPWANWIGDLASTTFPLRRLEKCVFHDAWKTLPGAQTLAAIDARNSPSRKRGGHCCSGLT